ncbi:MAG: hypothetical protein R3320_10005, partial [Nitriliruptorales bacterium]|nr:hypothetical protein [Nitriliruptorales bacterium]
MSRTPAARLDDALVELVEAAAELASAPSIGETLERFVASAGRQIGARVAVGELHVGDRHFVAASLAPSLEEHRAELVPPPAWVTEQLEADRRSVRLSEQATNMARPADARAPLGSVLATALRNRRGDRLGTAFLAGREAGGDFTPEDQVVLEQLGA